MPEGFRFLWLADAAAALLVVLAARHDILGFRRTGAGVVPKACTVPLFVLGIGRHLAAEGAGNAALAAAAGIALLAFVFLLGNLASSLAPGGRFRLGGGDAKLLIACGAYVGWKSLWVLMVLLALATAAFELAGLVRRAGTLRPSALAGAFLRELRLELLGCGEPVRTPYAARVAAAFVPAVILIGLGVV